MAKTITKRQVRKRNLKVVENLARTAGECGGRHAALLGEGLMGQPRVVAVAPAFRLMKFRVGARDGHKLGEVFPITCSEGMHLDNTAKASIRHALMHLGIREVEYHAEGEKSIISGFSSEVVRFGKGLRLFSGASIDLTEMEEVARECGLTIVSDKRMAEYPLVAHLHTYNFGKGAMPWIDVLTKATDTHTFGETHAYRHTKISWKNEKRETEALIVECSCSPLGARQAFEGHNIAVVSNLGNGLSGTALAAIKQAVLDGVPVIGIMGHSNCIAIGDAMDSNDETLPHAIRESLQRNIGEDCVRKGDVGIAGYMNAHNSVRALAGEILHPTWQGTVGDVARLINEMGTVVVHINLDTDSGEMGFMPRNI